MFGECHKVKTRVAHRPDVISGVGGDSPEKTVKRAGCRGPGGAIPMLKECLEKLVVLKHGANRPDVSGIDRSHAVDLGLIARVEGRPWEYAPLGAIPAFDHLLDVSRIDARDAGGPCFGGRNVHNAVEVTGVVACDHRSRERRPFGAVEVNGGLSYGPDIGRRRGRHRKQTVVAHPVMSVRSMHYVEGGLRVRRRPYQCQKHGARNAPAAWEAAAGRGPAPRKRRHLAEDPRVSE